MRGSTESFGSQLRHLGISSREDDAEVVREPRNFGGVILAINVNQLIYCKNFWLLLFLSPPNSWDKDGGRRLLPMAIIPPILSKTLSVPLTNSKILRFTSLMNLVKASPESSRDTVETYFDFSFSRRQGEKRREIRELKE